ncbi:MAG: Gfo/Idh/MocA family oxidoreductase [Candidatus Hinthialibacter antarcticus]|nr:Gfo/Idh/MocA family oxidoreductase [Candidatus Hinthialibacter antarcticus]
MLKTNSLTEKPKQNRRSFIKRTGLFTTAATSFTALSASRIMGANDRLGYGLIGSGGRGHSHLQAVAKLQDDSNVDIIAVCDAYRPRMTIAAERFDVKKQFMDHRDLLSDPDIDVVSIATPDHIHGYQAIDAINAKKDVYCEKPVTHWRQFNLTKQLAKTVEQSSQVIQLGTQGMADGAWALMKQLVQDGQIGQPIHAECGYFRVGDWGERGMPIDDPNAKPGGDLNWGAFLGDSPKRDFDVSRYFRWRMYEDYAGGPVTDLYPHSLTPVLSILGVTMPDAVVATGGKFRYQEREIPDTFNMLIDYPEQLTVVVMGTQGNNYPGASARGAGNRVPIIRGWEGTLTIRNDDVVFTHAEESSKKDQTFPIEYGEDFIRFWGDFFHCIRKRDKNTLSPMDLGFHVQTALQMGMLAFRHEKTIKFDQKKEEIVL